MAISAIFLVAKKLMLDGSKLYGIRAQLELGM